MRYPQTPPRRLLAAVVTTLALAATGLIGISPNTASAAFAGDNGDLLYVSDRADGELEIWRQAPQADATATRLTNREAPDIDPDWHPAGDRFVHSASRLDGSSFDLVVTVGGEAYVLTAAQEDDFAASWSPDGSQIAFVRGDLFTGGTVHVIDMHTRTVTPLAGSQHGDWTPVWSPQGDRIAVSTDEGIEVIFLFNGTRMTVSDGADTSPEWSPDGEHLAFVRWGSENDQQFANIFRVDAEGGTPVPLTTGTDLNLDPAWSPDGNQIAFASDRGTGDDLDIYVMDAEEGDTTLTQVTDSAGDDLLPTWGPSHDWETTYWFTWYDGTHGRPDWVLATNTSATPQAVHIEVLAPVPAERRDILNWLEPGQSWTPQFPDVMGGPVRVRMTGEGISSIRSLWQTGQNENFEEVNGQLSPHQTHRWPWYDGVSTEGANWVHVVNPGPEAANVTLTIGGTQVASTTVPALQNWNWQSTTHMGGPVILQSDQPVFASQRVLWDRVNFSETPGVAPAPETYFPWYDSEGTQERNWILIANTTETASEVQVRLGQDPDPKATRTVQPGEVWTPTFPGVMDGPVRVLSQQPVVVTQRAIWGGWSMDEVSGTAPRNGGLFTWYDSVSTDNRDWVLIANVGGTEAAVTVRIGGEVVHTQTLQAGQVTTPRFPNRMGGPVQVDGPESSSLVISRRTLWGPRADFTELLPF